MLSASWAPVTVFSSYHCSVGVVSSGSGLFDVDVIVLDEVHYLSDISRGTVWEETVCWFALSLSPCGSLCFATTHLFFLQIIRLFIAQKKFSLFVYQQPLQILMS